MIKTTVELKQQVRDDLKEWKDGQGHKSMSDAIAALLRDAQGGAGDDGDDGDDGENEDVPRRRRKLNVRDALYSLDILSERVGMLEYLTGFERGEVDLLIRCLQEVIFHPLFFCSLLLWVARWFVSRSLI